jgi:hypothetical protein
MLVTETVIVERDGSRSEEAEERHAGDKPWLGRNRKKMIMFAFGGQFVTSPNHEHERCL